MTIVAVKAEHKRQIKKLYHRLQRFLCTELRLEVTHIKQYPVGAIGNGVAASGCHFFGGLSRHNGADYGFMQIKKTVTHIEYSLK